MWYNILFMDKELEIFIGATGDKEVPIFVPGARKKRDPEKPAPSRRIDPMMFQSASDAGVASLEEGHDGLPDLLRHQLVMKIINRHIVEAKRPTRGSTAPRHSSSTRKRCA